MRLGLLKYRGQSSKEVLVASLHFLKDNIQIIMSFSFASSVWNTLHMDGYFPPVSAAVKTSFISLLPFHLIEVDLNNCYPFFLMPFITN